MQVLWGDNGMTDLTPREKLAKFKEMCRGITWTDELVKEYKRLESQIIMALVKAEKLDKVFHGNNQVNKALDSMIDDLIKEEEKTKQLEDKIKELEFTLKGANEIIYSSTGLNDELKKEIEKLKEKTEKIQRIIEELERTDFGYWSLELLFSEIEKILEGKK